MARKSATQTFVKTTTWKASDDNTAIEGYYINKETFEGQYGPSTKYVIEGNDGVMYGVFGSASLDRQFKNVPEGCYVWINYEGEVKTKNGRTVKQYSVDYDDEIVK